MIVPREPSWRAVGVAWAIAVALIVLMLLFPACACRPASPAQSWADYVRARPYYRDLSPAADHPCWRGSGQVCGAGKCE